MSNIDKLDLGNVNRLNMLAGTVRPTWSAGTNTWAFINDGAHAPMNFTGVSSDGIKLTVTFDGTFDKILSFMATSDEAMATSAQSNSGSPFYTSGPYTCGVSSLSNAADIYISKLASSSALIVYNGTSWTPINLTGLTQTFVDPGSPAWTITWTSGRLRIQDLPFNMRGIPQVAMYAFNGSIPSILAFHPSINVISANFFDIYFWDIANNVQYTAAAPPANFGVWLDFGTFATRVNPSTEDFGFNSNIWMVGFMKES